MPHRPDRAHPRRYIRRDGLPGTGDGDIKRARRHTYGRRSHLHQGHLQKEYGEDGLKIDRLLCDSGYATDVVYKYCKTAPPYVIAAKGKGVGAINKPFSEYEKRKGWQFGHHWYINRVKGNRQCMIDTNFWKSFVSDALAASPGEPGSLTLYGKSGKVHTLIADHATSEYGQEVKAGGNVVVQFLTKVNRDNHLYDSIVGCFAAASMQGMKTLQSILPAVKIKKAERPQHKITIDGESQTTKSSIGKSVSVTPTKEPSKRRLQPTIKW